MTTVPEVIDRLTAIRDSMGEAAPDCGISYFSDLYLTITKSIWDHIQSGNFFCDNGYLNRLDVVFANRYFDALRAWANGAGPPKAWTVLFNTPADGEVGPVRLAAAGVNAHINLDLAVATVDTGREVGDSELEKGARTGSDVLVSRRDDYIKINDVFAENMDALLDRLLAEKAAAGEDPEPLSARGRLMTRIVAAARQFAWEDAEELWALPRSSDDWATKERHMDAVASLIGRGVLVDLPG